MRSQKPGGVRKKRTGPGNRLSFLLIALTLPATPTLSYAYQSQEPPAQSEELLGSLYLNYLLSDEQSEGAWKLITEALQEASSKQPNNARGKSILLFAGGQLARARGEPQRAEESFEKARKLNPAEILPWLGLAESAIDRGDRKKAGEYLQKAKELVTQSAPDFAQHLYLAKIGSLYLKAGKHSEAVSIYEGILSRKPAWDMAHRRLAESFLRSGQPVQALNHANQAVTAEPNEPKNHYLLASVQRELRDLPGALESLCRAVELDPENANYRYDLGAAYESMGQKTDALREYARAADLAEKDPFRFSKVQLESAAALNRLHP